MWKGDEPDRDLLVKLRYFNRNAGQAPDARPRCVQATWGNFRVTDSWALSGVPETDESEMRAGTFPGSQGRGYYGAPSARFRVWLRFLVISEWVAVG